MKKKEYYKEISGKGINELQKSLASLRAELLDLNFKASQNQLKEVRKIRVLKKSIAQVLTVIQRIGKK